MATKNTLYVSRTLALPLFLHRINLSPQFHWRLMLQKRVQTKWPIDLPSNVLVWAVSGLRLPVLLCTVSIPRVKALVLLGLFSISYNCGYFLRVSRAIFPHCVKVNRIWFPDLRLANQHLLFFAI